MCGRGRPHGWHQLTKKRLSAAIEQAALRGTFFNESLNLSINLNPHRIRSNVLFGEITSEVEWETYISLYMSGRADLEGAFSSGSHGDMQKWRPWFWSTAQDGIYFIGCSFYPHSKESWVTRMDAGGFIQQGHSGKRTLIMGKMSCELSAEQVIIQIWADSKLT